MLSKLVNQYKKIFLIKENFFSFLLSLIFFGVALFVQGLADSYLLSIRGTAVNDLILDHLPLLDIDSLMIQSALLLTAISIFLAVTKPKLINFTLKSLALFIIIRAFLVSVTHLGASPQQLLFDSNDFGFKIYNALYNTTNDFFFSAHTGAPFLGALILWHEKPWRYFFIFASIISGASVLLAHMHYSIDVFAAPFIAHSIFMISKDIFKKDYELLRSN